MYRLSRFVRGSIYYCEVENGGVWTSDINDAYKFTLEQVTIFIRNHLATVCKLTGLTIESIPK
jgi:hypothetical protein